MTQRHSQWKTVGGGIVLCLAVSSCTSVTNSLQSMNTPKQLAVMPGEVTLQVVNTHQSDLDLPSSPRLASGRVLAFSPVEFRSDKERYSIITDSLPLGRYVALRHAGEGVLNGIGKGETKSFVIHYDARYPDLAAARKDFPTLAPERFKTITLNGKSQIEIEQWHYRLTMLFSKERQAYRVLLDQMEYIAPQPPQQTQPNSDGSMTTAPVSSPNVPIIVAFSYRHPELTTENVVQQNIFFEFTVQAATGVYHGNPQISGWVPLQTHADTAPYNVGLIVAEVNIQDAQFYTKLLDFLKTIRGVI